MSTKRIIMMLATTLLLMQSCGQEKKSDGIVSATAKVKENVSIDPMADKGVGPISSIEIGEIDELLVKTGTEVFEANCTACHKMGKRFVGPDLVGVTKRRTPEWIMNMILNPDVMVKENQLAKELLMEYSAPMANQSLSEGQARAILEYFRTVDEI